nr:EcsC family protein [Bacillus subtilis]
MTDNQLLMQEALEWKMHFLRKDSMFERFSKRVQTKVNERIPEKIHTVVTESVRKMVEATMVTAPISSLIKWIQVHCRSVKKTNWRKKRLFLIRKWQLLRESAPERAAFF